MTLSELQLDALTEIFNLGVGQAADSLSQIAGESVILSVPRVTVTTQELLAAQMQSQGCQNLCAVRQRFSGVMETDAVLMFPIERSLLLVQMMVGSDFPLEQLGEMEQDALAEIGNILLNGIVGSMADALHLAFDSSLPAVEQGSVAEVLLSNPWESGGILSLEVNFEIAKHEIQGFIGFMLDIKAINFLRSHLSQYLSGELG